MGVLTRNLMGVLVHLSGLKLCVPWAPYVYLLPGRALSFV